MWPATVLSDQVIYRMTRSICHYTNVYNKILNKNENVAFSTTKLRALLLPFLVVCVLRLTRIFCTVFILFMGMLVISLDFDVYISRYVNIHQYIQLEISLSYTQTARYWFKTALNSTEIEKQKKNVIS